MTIDIAPVSLPWKREGERVMVGGRYLESRLQLMGGMHSSCFQSDLINLRTRKEEKECKSYGHKTLARGLFSCRRRENQSYTWNLAMASLLRVLIWIACSVEDSNSEAYNTRDILREFLITFSLQRMELKEDAEIWQGYV